MNRSRIPYFLAAALVMVATGFAWSPPGFAQTPATTREAKEQEVIASFRRAWSEGRIEDALAAWSNYKALAAEAGRHHADANLPNNQLFLVGRVGDSIVASEEIFSQLAPSPGEIAGLARAYAARGASAKGLAELERAWRQPGLTREGRYALAAVGQEIALGTRDRTQLVRWLTEMINNEPSPATQDILRRQIARLDNPAEHLATLQASLRTPATTAQTKGYLAPWLAYYGDAPGALEALDAEKRALGIFGGATSPWLAVYRDARKLPGFRQLVQDLRLVNLWRKSGWSDFCKPTTGDDFECQ